MTKLKLTSLAIITAVLAASAPNSASAIYVHRPPVVTPHHGHSVVPWFVIGCAGGIILAAIAANSRDNRELTTAEAWSCGMLFWLSQPKKARKEHRRISRKG